MPFVKCLGAVCDSFLIFPVYLFSHYPRTLEYVFSACSGTNQARYV